MPDLLLDFSGLRLWLDASDLEAAFGNILPYSSGETIEVAKDKSGQGMILVQNVSTARPSFVYGGLNNLPVLRFDGANDYLGFNKIETVRTVFFVLNRKTGNQGFLLGDT